MRFPNKLWQAQAALSFDDISGNPAIAIGKDNSIYFAVAARGSNTMAGTTRAYDIAVGKMDANGALVWYRIFPDMNTETDETEPAVALGPDDELYVAYVTRGATANNFNMADIPTFCPQVCTNPGREDIACARIDTLDGPVLRWVVQSGRFNSCNRETNPSISIDKVNRLLYIGYQSNANVQCNTSTGSPNVAIVCLNLSGEYYWTDSLSLNSIGLNQNAVVAADDFSNVYLAYETRVRGQARQVEVIKYSTVQSDGAFVRYAQEWRAGDVSNIVSYPLDSENPLPTICVTPSIVCDPRGRVYIAFTTDGVMYGQVVTGSLHDLVVTCLEPDGKRAWIYQGPRYNQPVYRYIDCFDPYITCDAYGNLYVSLPTQENDGFSLLVFKLSPSYGDPIWLYTDSLNKSYNAYPLARNVGIRPVLPTSPIPYRRLALAIHKNMLVGAMSLAQSSEPTEATEPTEPPTAPVTTHYAPMFAFDERLYFENISAFGYMNEIKSGCGCPTNGCGC
jgi:hypothetical protein